MAASSWMPRAWPMPHAVKLEQRCSQLIPESAGSSTTASNLSTTMLIVGPALTLTWMLVSAGLSCPASRAVSAQVLRSRQVRQR